MGSTHVKAVRSRTLIKLNLNAYDFQRCVTTQLKWRHSFKAKEWDKKICDDIESIKILKFIWINIATSLYIFGEYTLWCKRNAIYEFLDTTTGHLNVARLRGYKSQTPVGMCQYIDFLVNDSNITVARMEKGHEYFYWPSKLFYYEASFETLMMLLLLLLQLFLLLLLLLLLIDCATNDDDWECWRTCWQWRCCCCCCCRNGGWLTGFFYAFCHQNGK